MIKPVIFWLRQDLRLHDNPALIAAAVLNQPIIPLYILDPTLPMGGASRWWLHHSLTRLKESFQTLGLQLIVRKGDAESILHQLIDETGADHVVWNRRYDASSIAVDRAIKQSFLAAGVKCDSFNSHLLFEPWTIKNQQGKPYQVFTSFWNYCRQHQHPPLPEVAPSHLIGYPTPHQAFDETIEGLGLLPTKPDWAGGLKDTWQPGEANALARFHEFLQDSIAHYKEERDLPAIDATSRLSPYLAWGEISPRVIYYETLRLMHENPGNTTGAQTFLSEIGWREFSYHLLFHFPDLPTKPLRAKFDNFPWSTDTKLFELWTKGLTGYPIVDAGMRQLWHTGWMHNRVRMIVASFLVKDLLLPWQEGAAWFWDTLVDADVASNSASWQWVAGCGADAAPYFRVFNPTLQGEKFDPQGEYIRRWVPELQNLVAENIHNPSNAPPARLTATGVKLGQTYPLPVVDHAKARLRALSLFHELEGE